MGFYCGIPGSGVGSLSMTTSTNPAANAATSTAIVDAYAGVIVLQNDGTPTNQTMGTPTSATAGKVFTVVNNDTSTESFTVTANSVAFTITPGEAQAFIWDGSAWGPTDLGITAIPVAIAQGGTGAITRGTAVNALLPYVQSDTGATYTHDKSGTTFIVNSASDQIITTPITTSGDIGCWFEVIKLGTGKVTISTTTPATIDDSSVAGTLYCSDSGKAYIKVKVAATNVYVTESATNTWTTT